MNNGMTRRRASLLIGAGGLLAASGGVMGRQPTGRSSGSAAAKKPESVLDRAMKRVKEDDRTLRINLQVNAYQQKSNRRDEMPRITKFNFASGVVVFPVLESSGTHEVWTERVKSECKIDDRVVDDSVELLTGYPAGTRLGRWDLGKVENGAEMSLELELPCTSWETEFDEELLAKFPWPKGSWPEEAASTFKPQVGIDYGDPVIQKLVSGWTEGKSAKGVPPVTLAKFFAAQVLELVKPSGEGTEAHSTGQFSGIKLQRASVSARDGRCSFHDVPLLLAAVYRAAGLPARTVIGWDVSESKGDSKNFLDKGSKGGRLRSWVEFCLYDEAAQKALWVPVDIMAQRGSSSTKAPKLDRKWKFFGNNEDSNDIIPFAFQHHPPTTVASHGDDYSYGFWGWMVIPEPPEATQYLRFTAFTTPMKPSDRRERERSRGG